MENILLQEDHVLTYYSCMFQPMAQLSCLLISGDVVDEKVSLFIRAMKRNHLYEMIQSLDLTT